MSKYKNWGCHMMQERYKYFPSFPPMSQNDVVRYAAMFAGQIYKYQCPITKTRYVYIVAVAAMTAINAGVIPKCSQINPRTIDAIRKGYNTGNIDREYALKMPEYFLNIPITSVELPQTNNSIMIDGNYRTALAVERGYPVVFDLRVPRKLHSKASAKVPEEISEEELDKNFINGSVKDLFDLNESHINDVLKEYIIWCIKHNIFRTT